MSAILRVASDWQKKECLYCDGNGVFEAAYQKNNDSSNIRCCHKASCIRLAFDEAEII